MNKRKEFSKLNLLDRFLFNEAMEDPENMKTVLDIIFGQDIPLKSAPHSEKEMRTLPDNRQARRSNCFIRKSARSGRTKKWRRSSCERGKKEK